MENATLSWRIPTTGDPRQLKLALAQVGLATIVAALVLLVAAPRPWLVPALVGLIPLAIFVAYRRWQRFHQSLVGPANVWLDEAGLHWQDGAGDRQSFARGDVTAFRVGIEADTLRAVPALTLNLSGGFESQPLELYPPATPDVVKQHLSQSWGIEDRASEQDDRKYDYAVDVYSECHDEFRTWHFEGTPVALTELFELIRLAAAELPAPPLGAKPAYRVLLCRRREPTRLRVAHAPAAHFDYNLLAAPAAVMVEFAAKTVETLSATKAPGDSTFELRLPSQEVWTFHLHIRES